MKHVSILVPRGAAALGCIEGSFILFSKTNDFLAERGRPPLFTVQLVGLTDDSQVYDRLFSVRPDVTIDKVKKTDLIIIPAVNGEMGEVIDRNKGFLPWIVRHYTGGAEVASLCVGAFLLAATGLMKGKQCATHWMSARDFRTRFPEVNLVSESIITDDAGIYTSGGAHSFWNLLLYIVEKYADREIAIYASKFYEIEIDRYNQSPFLIFNGQKDHKDEAVRKAQDLIETNYREKITVDRLSTIVAVGRRSLERRFKQATGNTVSEYMQRVRVEAAKKGLETGRKNVSEVMYDAGYTDTKAFREVFRKFAGMSPLDYRLRYTRDVVSA
ncbi:MAG TPA: helix-turn-helix domain-containing protein [Spirochaetia bacterium]|nr:helix-turn-helix domain-containing protein [Spirochaetia bacterium]